MIDRVPHQLTVVCSVRRNSESVVLASAEISQGNNDLSQRTEQQAAALDETAASPHSRAGSLVTLPIAP